MTHTKEMPGGPPADLDCYQIMTHGGLGDCLWVYKKLAAADKPLFVHIANENRHRPRRSGILCDHLPRVAGWRFADQTFTPGGHDWTQSADDPACAIGKTWAEIAPKPGEILRLECNRWLEGGRRLEGWLPDLATQHHFPFLPPAQPTRPLKRPCVVLHLAGWADVPDKVWDQVALGFHNLAHLYVVGGSYDRRPRELHNRLSHRVPMTLLEDVPWCDLYGVLKACDFCFGHASGFTAIAD